MNLPARSLSALSSAVFYPLLLVSYSLKARIALPIITTGLVEVGPGGGTEEVEVPRPSEDLTGGGVGEGEGEGEGGAGS